MPFVKTNEIGEKIIALNWVKAPTYELLAELKDTYEYPVDGWAWEDEMPEE